MIDHIVILCRFLPDHTKSSGELRFSQILRHLRNRARQLTVFAEHEGNRSLHPELPVHPISELEERLPAADLAFLEFWYMDLYIPTLRARGIPIILDSVDIEFLRREREGLLLGAAPDYSQEHKTREIAAYRAADQLWAVSQLDAEHVRNLNANIAVIPNIFDPLDEIVPFDQRAGVCFVGSYSHQPNVDGLRWYRDEIYPRLSDIPHTILGNGAPEDLRAFPGFIGGVPRSTDYVSKALVSIAPLRYGAGLKGKVLEALACGTPVVTTCIGDEGYGTGDREATIVADEAADFAAAVRRLTEDEELWNKLSLRGRQIADAYTPAVVGPRIDTALQSALSADGTAP